jgi:pyrroline-5-carboxylate reductase
LLKSKFITSDNLTITRRNVEALSSLKSQGVNVTSDNRAAIQQSDVIIVALKPYNVKEVLESLRDNFDKSRHIVISVVTGVSLKDSHRDSNAWAPVFRAMPNTAIAIQESVTCICHEGALNEQVNYVTRIV